jgi:hypothetical protein
MEELHKKKNSRAPLPITKGAREIVLFFFSACTLQHLFQRLHASAVLRLEKRKRKRNRKK